MFLTGRLNFTRLVVYIIGQFIGSFIGSAIVFIVYYDSLRNFKDGMYSMETAAIFATYPNENLSIVGGFLDQVVGTIILVLVVLSVNDPKNERISYLGSIVCGLASTAIGLGYGYNCGAPLNPTRDFAPRLFTFIAGWGAKTFSAGNYFFWVPIVAPMVITLKLLKQ
jgi:glycerol uptake facilitator-like aquaporin